jgi:hypothetical protein
LAAIRGVVEKARFVRGLCGRNAARTGDCVVLKHGCCVQYRRAKASVAEFHCEATRAAGRIAIGMAVVMIAATWHTQRRVELIGGSGVTRGEPTEEEMEALESRKIGDRGAARALSFTESFPAGHA